MPDFPNVFSFSAKNLKLRYTCMLVMEAICTPDCLDIVGITANRTRSKICEFAEVVMGKAGYKPGFIMTRESLPTELFTEDD